MDVADLGQPQRQVAVRAEQLAGDQDVTGTVHRLQPQHRAAVVEEVHLVAVLGHVARALPQAGVVELRRQHLAVAAGGVLAPPPVEQRGAQPLPFGKPEGLARRLLPEAEQGQLSADPAMVSVVVHDGSSPGWVCREPPQERQAGRGSARIDGAAPRRVPGGAASGWWWPASTRRPEGRRAVLATRPCAQSYAKRPCALYRGCGFRHRATRCTGTAAVPGLLAAHFASGGGSTTTSIGRPCAVSRFR